MAFTNIIKDKKLAELSLETYGKELLEQGEIQITIKRSSLKSEKLLIQEQLVKLPKQTPQTTLEKLKIRILV